METIKTRFEKRFPNRVYSELQETPRYGDSRKGDWILESDNVLAFIAQELTLVAEEVEEKIGAPMRTGIFTKSFCDGHDKALNSAAAIIRAHVKDLEE